WVKDSSVGDQSHLDHRGSVMVYYALKNRYRPQCDGHHLARHRSEPKSELQHVTSLLRVTPLCDFIEPRRCELRSPQALRIFRGEELRDDTARPNQLPF